MIKPQARALRRQDNTLLVTKKNENRDQRPPTIYIYIWTVVLALIGLISVTQQADETLVLTLTYPFYTLPSDLVISSDIPLTYFPSPMTDIDHARARCSSDEG